jgi:site-specific DNA-methyltransferase (cytosine-N4-specific)
VSHADQTFPTQSQLLFPALTAIEEGAETAKEICDAVACAVDLPRDLRTQRGRAGKAGEINLWDRHIRWVAQRAKLLGLAHRRDESWMLTEQGRSALRNIRPGAIVIVFETDNGLALWAEAAAGVASLEDGLVQLILTSPPYPLLRRKDYAGQHSSQKHVEWLLSHIADWRRVLTPDGSIVLNLGDVWMPGMPCIDSYQERLVVRLCDTLGLHLCQKLYWHNPSKVPGPAEWVNIRRVRVTNAVENLWWFSPTANPKADNRHILRPYSAAMRGRLAAGGEKGAERPSGHRHAKGAFGRDNGGSIAHNLLTIPNTASNDDYQRSCRLGGLPAHPARFPIALAEWLIRFLTDPGDLVLDPFAGSLTTCAAAESLNRRWIGIDKCLEYLEGGRGRRALASAQPARAGA